MNLVFKKCDREDFEDFYILKCDEENIYWSGHRDKPNKDNLNRWYKEQLSRGDRIFFIIRSEGIIEPVGYLYLDIAGDGSNIIETGHGVNSIFKGKGIGTQLIKYALEYTQSNLKDIRIIEGWIMEDNIGSIKNVLKNGYKDTGENKWINVQGSQKEKKFKRYIYRIKDLEN